jgi:hypothetical protein
MNYRPQLWGEVIVPLHEGDSAARRARGGASSPLVVGLFHAGRKLSARSTPLRELRSRRPPHRGGQ